jgi:hypothetical protein
MGKLEGLPTLVTVGNTTFNPQYTPVIVPDPYANPPDVFESFHSPKNYTCEVKYKLLVTSYVIGWGSFRIWFTHVDLREMLYELRQRAALMQPTSNARSTCRAAVTAGCYDALHQLCDESQQL